MPNKHPRMRLCPEEEAFLRRWVYDEAHFEDGPGPAKRLQLEHGVIPADLAELVAAAFPVLADQRAIGQGPPPTDAPVWPWSAESFGTRLAEARDLLRAYRGMAS
jgi:hypothetical protein